MSALSKRVAALEERAAPALDVPVFVISMDGRGDTSQPMFTDYGGHTWTQLPGESREAFAERAKAAALKVFKPEGPHPTLFLVLQHPRYTREKWLERFRDRGEVEASSAAATDQGGR